MSKLIGFILLLAAATATATEVTVPVGVEDLLSGRYKDVRTKIKAATKEFKVPDPKLKATLAVTSILEARATSIINNAKKLIGQKVTLATNKKSVKGRVATVDEHGITITVYLVINRQVVGESKRKLEWNDLTPAEMEKLAGDWQPPGADGYVARAILALSSGDIPSAGVIIKHASDHALTDYIVGKIKTAKVALAKAEARAKINVASSQSSDRRTLVSIRVADKAVHPTVGDLTTNSLVGNNRQYVFASVPKELDGYKFLRMDCRANGDYEYTLTYRTNLFALVVTKPTDGRELLESGWQKTSVTIRSNVGDLLLVYRKMHKAGTYSMKSTGNWAYMICGKDLDFQFK